MLKIAVENNLGAQRMMLNGGAGEGRLSSLGLPRAVHVQVMRRMRDDGE
jgi:hypothetical protein